jgi:hypothetical protein
MTGWRGRDAHPAAEDGLGTTKERDGYPGMCSGTGSAVQDEPVDAHRLHPGSVPVLAQAPLRLTGPP